MPLSFLHTQNYLLVNNMHFMLDDRQGMSTADIAFLTSALTSKNGVKAIRDTEGLAGQVNPYAWPVLRTMP